MRSVYALVAGALSLAVAVPAAAQGLKVPEMFWQPRPAPAPPKVDWNWRPSAEPAPARPSVVCGMTVIPADPKIDPKIRVAPPNNGVKYTLKVVEPTVCKP
jgi:hypothetical protein